MTTSNHNTDTMSTNGWDLCFWYWVESSSQNRLLLGYGESRRDQMYMFDKFHLMFNLKPKVSHDVFKNKNECQLTSTFPSKISPQCHMLSSACHLNL